MPESIASSCVKVENFYFVAQMYRCLIETNLEKQTRNLNNSLLHVKKIVEIIEKETNSEALDWLCKIMLKERNDLRFLLPKDLSQNKKEQLFVDEIDQDPFVLRFRKVS